MIGCSRVFGTGRANARRVNVNTAARFDRRFHKISRRWARHCVIAVAGRCLRCARITSPDSIGICADSDAPQQSFSTGHAGRSRRPLGHAATRATTGVDFTEAAARKLANDLRIVRVQRADGTIEEQLGLYVEPVQLQVVCYRLWDRLPVDAQQIVEADVVAVGNVDSALSDYYAERVAGAARETGIRERAIRDWVERQPITAQGIRGQVLQGPDQGLDSRAVQKLLDAYLVRAEKRRGATWLELAHDRLIAPVQANNAAWREANLSTLQRQADLWEKQNRPDARCCAIGR